MEERTPAEVLQLVKDEGVEIVDFRFSRPARHHAALLDAGPRADRGRLRGGPRLRRLVDPRVPGDPGVGHDPHPDPNTAVIDPFRQHKTLNINCFVARPGHRRDLHPRPALRRQEGRGVPQRPPASPTPRTSGPRPSSSSSTTCGSRPEPNGSFYSVDSVEGAWNTGTDEGPNLGYKPRYKEGYFPVPPMDHYQDLRSEMVARAAERRHRDRGAPPRGRHRGGQAEIDMRSTRC